MKNLLILIPPSEGKQKGGTLKKLGKANKLVSPMIKALINFKGDHEKLLGVKGPKLEESIETNKNILTSPTMPAIERYSGVVFDGIDYSSLSSKGKNYFDKHVRIISAIFGLVSPQDLIPDYKLKIEKLNADKYWKPIITDLIKESYIIDLLPQAHAKALSYSNGVRIDFVLNKDGKRKPAGHNGKLIKGKFVRFLCENQIKSVKDFSKFKEDGFVFDGTNFIKST